MKSSCFSILHVIRALTVQILSHVFESTIQVYYDQMTSLNFIRLGTGHYLSRGGAGANKGWVTIFYAEV